MDKTNIMDTVKLPLLPKPTLAVTRSPVSSSYFTCFKSSLVLSTSAAVTHVAFSPTSADLALITDARIQLYTRTGEAKKHISKFKHQVTCVGWRHDGKLLAAGDASSLIQVSLSLFFCFFPLFVY